jgi:hypothetical protein
MADFLNNLIAKNVSPQEGIQPRPLSRFEPSMEAVAVPRMAQDSEGEQALLEPADLEVPPRTQSIISPQKKPSQTSLLTPQASALEESGTFYSLTSQSIHHSSHLSMVTGEEHPDPVHPESRPDLPPLQTYQERLDLPARIPLEPQSHATSHDKSLAQPKIPGPESVAPNWESSSPSTQAHDLPSDTLPQAREFRLERIVDRTLISSIKVTTQSGQPENSPTDLLAHQPATHDLHPIVPRLPDLDSRGVMAQPIPTINVTIGRIEVRATPGPPRQPGRSSPASIIMSLDEYLLQAAHKRKK